MRNLYLLAAVLLSFLKVQTAMAETVSPYVIDFSVAINTDQHDFKVGTGWGHIVDSYDNGYTRYTWQADGGVDNSACLEIGSQKMINFDDNSEHILQDMLVTPAVSGKVSLYAKITRTWSDDAGVKFYYVTEKDGMLKAGDEIKPTVYQLNGSEYQLVELPSLPKGTRIGIRGWYVKIDHFRAESAEVDMVSALKVVSAKWAGSEYTDYDADGNLELAYQVVVQNVGDRTLKLGSEGYSLSLTRQVMNTVYSTVNIAQTLQPGETSSPISVKTVINKRQIQAEKLFLNVQENISKTTVPLPEIAPNDYAPRFSLTGAYGRTPLRTGYRIDYGMSRGQVDVSFFLRNDGAVMQKLTEITATTGFASSLRGPIEIAPHDSVKLTVSLMPDQKGEKHGHLTVRGENGVDIVLNLNGYSVHESQWFVDFESDSKPVGFQVEQGWYVSNYPTLVYRINNRSSMEVNKQEPVKLISPLVEVKDGESLTFELAKQNSASFMNIYYSADRKTWRQVARFTHDQMSDSVLSKSFLYNNYAFTRFTVDNIPAGRWYIAFESGATHLDNILGYHLIGSEHDVYINHVNIPSTGTVNTSMEVNAILTNIMKVKELANDYQFGFYLDDRLVLSADPADLEALWERSVSGKFTPHQSGTYKAYWKFTRGDVVVVSDTVSVTIAPESTYQVNKTGERIWSYELAPARFYDYYSESECIYLADELGLAPGAEIKQLIYRGYNPSTELNANLSVWVQNTEADQISEPYAFTSTQEMTQVYDGMIPVRKVGTMAMQDDVLVITLAKPFVYTGGNLRVRVGHRAIEEAARVYFDVQNADGRCIARSGTVDLDKVDIHAYKLPILRVGAEAKTVTVSGRVTDKEGNAVSGATVMLKSGDVEYSALTDAQGHYQLVVIKSQLNYQALFMSEGRETETSDVMLTGDAIELNHIFGDTTGVNNVKASDAQVVGYYSIDGRKLNAPMPGITIVRYADGTSRKNIIR